MTKKQKKVLFRIIVTVIICAIIYFLPFRELYLIPYLIIGYDILFKAAKGIINKQPFDENFLMAVATVGAIILGEYLEGVAVMLFYQIGELFQSYAVGKSRRSISELMDIRPDYANIEDENGELVKADPFEVNVGTVITVKPGEKIPLDGVVVAGESSLDTAALTGESAPRDVSVDSKVQSGCINLTGVLKIRTEKEFGDSTVSKILDLVENASSKKSKSENFISKFARFYTPAVCISALALAVIPPIVNILLGRNALFCDWIYRALTFLVISCPCALVISIPLGFFAGIGGAGNIGILIKGSNYIETLSKVKTVVFDKTGTLTKGAFEVSGIHHNTIDSDSLLRFAAYAECYSIHPISDSLQKAFGKEIDKSRVENVKEISGQGVIADVDNVSVAVGNSKLMKTIGAECIACHHIGTVVHVAIGGEYAGHILITDALKAYSKNAIKALYKAGIKKTALLTGDIKAVGEAVGRDLSIDEVYPELLPNDKVSVIEDIINSGSDRDKVAFVGDGINDAPVLTRADVGIAMGALGADAAIEAADVVLMDDNPLKVVKAIKIAKRCMRIVYENIYFAIGIKLLCLILGALGIANMWFAIFADVGVMVLAVLNAIRTLYVKNV